jgi:hypothetical protein
MYRVIDRSYSRSILRLGLRGFLERFNRRPEVFVMSTDSQTLPRSSPAASPGAARRRERRFFSGTAIVLAAAVFWGFAPTYYLHGPLGGDNQLTTALHWHGAAFSAWMVLLVAQTSLVAAGRTDLHRRLGIAGVVLAVAMMGLGAYVAISRTADGTFVNGNGVPPLIFLAVPLATMVVFPILFGAALWYRKRPDFHKRLVLLGTLELVTAALARVPIVAPFGPLGFFGATDLFVVALAIYDWQTRGRLHPATLWGGLLLILSQPARLLIGATPQWQAIAGWLTS